MNLYRGINYWGVKKGAYVGNILPLLPGGIAHMVEACMGSGTLSANLKFAGMKQTAFELDKGMYTLNRCIQKRPYELIDLLKKTPYSRDVFESSKELLENYIKGISDYDELDVARAEYMALVLSYNSMRISYRSLDGYKKYDDKDMQRKCRMELERLRKNIYRDMPAIIIGNSYAWENLNILCDDFMNHIEVFTEGKDTLVLIDPPYLLSKRGMGNGKRNSSGYMIDWNEQEQRRFINFIKKIEKEPSHSRIMICNSFSINPQGEIDMEEMKNDPYNKEFLKAGFRLVEVQRKASSEIKNWKSDSPKKIKTEVVYVNYEDIIGEWSRYRYYDYDDIF